MGEFKWPKAEGYLKEKRWDNAFKVKAADINSEERRIRAVFNTPTKDRDGEIVYPKAFEKRIKSFEENPVLLWMHDPITHTPIGRVENLSITDEKMEGEVVFRPKGDSPKADDVFSCFEKGFLNSFSIGFRVFEVMQGKMANGDPGPLEIVDAELFEISAVAIPANPEALMQTEKAVKLIRQGQGHTEAKTLYAQPSDLDVLKRAAVVIKHTIKQQSAGDAVPDERLAAIEELRLASIGAVAEGLGKEGEALEKGLDDLLAEFETKGA